MKNGSSLTRTASARFEALEQRSLFSGEIDHGFGANGLVNVRDAGGNSVIGDAIVVQADGKTVVAGHLDTNANTAVITRYNANGSLDTGFGQGGYATVPNVKAYNISDVTVLANGKIVVSGQTFFRLNANGALDKSFSGDGINPSILASNRKSDDLVLPDGSYFELQYTFPSTNTVQHDRLFKFKADGTPDTTFGSGGKFDLGTLGNIQTSGVAVDGSGRVYVSFQTGEYGGDVQFSVARLTAAGKLDTTYGTAGVAKREPEYAHVERGLTVLKDGRALMITGENTERASTNDVLVFSADGKSSKYMPLSNSGGLFFARKIVQAADGSVYVGGSHREGLAVEDGYDGQAFAAVQHFKADLSLDKTYSPDKDATGGFRYSGYGFSSATSTSDFALNASGQVLLLGETYADNVHRSDFVRLTAAGTSNRTYTSVSGRTLTINGSAANDSIRAYHVEDNGDNTGYYQTVIRFDDNGVLMSADAAYYPDVGGSQSELFSAFSTIVVNLGDGDDTFDGSGLLGTRVRVHGNKGNDRIIGTVLNDSLYGDEGTDTLIGNGGEDVIVT